jgi:two-component system, response regulator
MTNPNEVEILLVEDNPNDAEMVIKALEKNKISNKIFHISDGEEALDFIFAREKYIGRKNDLKPKVILLDLKLPKVSGLEVLKALKSDPVTRIIPVIVMTTSREESDMIESYQIGVNSYIVKPVDFDKFVEAIKVIGMYWLLLNQLPEK